MTQMRIFCTAMLIVTVLCLSWPLKGSAESSRFIISNCTMIDGTGNEPVSNALVLVKEGTIEYAGPADGAKIPEGYKEIDLHGATILPGFINAHIHEGFEQENLRRWLKAGVTSVRDVGGRQKPARVRIEKQRERAEDPLCARLFISTPMISRKGGYGQLQYGSVEELRAILSRTLTAGFDLVKTSVEDDCRGKKWNLISLEELQLICREAHEKGLRVSSHISWIRHIDLALQGGVDFLEHMVYGELDRATAEKVARKGIYWIPTLELHKRVGEIRGSSWHLDQSLPNLRRYNAVGGLTALGTDFGTDLGGGEAPFDKGFPITEVKLMQKAGLTPMQIIVAGTKHAAIVSGQGERLGTLERGKWADIIAVNGDPLVNIEILEKVSFVMKGGEIEVGFGERY